MPETPRSHLHQDGTPGKATLAEHVEALNTIRKLGEDLIESRDLLVTMADTLRACLLAAECDPPYPWRSGALKQQIREDITAFELLGLDWPVPERKP